MSEAKHTKGPWHMGIGNGTGSIFGPEGCGRSQLTEKGTALAPICIMVEGFGGVSYRHKYKNEEDLANARLIAAAPDLLKACELLLKSHRMLSTCTDSSCKDCQKAFDIAVENIRRAIFKATGEIK